MCKSSGEGKTESIHLLTSHPFDKRIIVLNINAYIWNSKRQYIIDIWKYVDFSSSNTSLLCLSFASHHRRRCCGWRKQASLAGRMWKHFIGYLNFEFKLNMGPVVKGSSFSDRILLCSWAVYCMIWDDKSLFKSVFIDIASLSLKYLIHDCKPNQTSFKGYVYLYVSINAESH